MLLGAIVIVIVLWVVVGMVSAAEAQSALPNNSKVETPPEFTKHISDDPKIIWGGGSLEGSSYSRIITPAVGEQLALSRLPGYKWGGPSEGTLMNAMKVTLNPTHVALGQADILSTLNGTKIAGTDLTYNFTVVQDDIADECLYLVTKSPSYETWGHVIENIWDINLKTGGELSGSFGTWDRKLTSIYPALQDVLSVEHTGSSNDIVQEVIDGDETVFGFFVTRPDPSSETFKKIIAAGLTLVPVIDFDLETDYKFKSLKIAQGGIIANPVFHDTACTQVQLITGHPDNLKPGDKNLRRLEATIERASAISGPEFKEFVVGKFLSWKDYLDSVREVGGDRLSALMDASKAKIAEISN
jgi:hypothetical protein